MKGVAMKTVKVAILGQGRSGRNIHAEYLITTPDGNPTYCVDNLKFYEEHWEPTEEEKNFNFIVGRFYNMLYKTLTEGKPLEITPQQVRQQIAVIEECHRQNKLK